MVVFGATGSGKTVVSKSIVEEAAANGIQIIAIDPKGDIGSLAIRNLDFRFKPYSDQEASLKGVSSESYEGDLSALYRSRLAETKVNPEMVKSYIDNVDVRIYTPRSSAGIQLALSPRLDAPPHFSQTLAEDSSLAFEILEMTSSTLAKMIGYDENKDKVQVSIISAILQHHWERGRDVTIEQLVQDIIDPPFEKLGKLPVSKLLGKRESEEFLSNANLLLTSPGIKAWFNGVPPDFNNFLETKGKTPINVIDLRGITTEDDKHLFVEYFLEQFFLWLIRQRGSQDTRYLLYFDEIHGYCPPLGNPPSKRVLIRLIKMGRAFGLGMLLSTQNPADIDYKVISNANTRLIGSLRMERDIERVRVGLDLKSDTDKTLSTLPSGKFYYHFFDRGESGLFSTRWLVSYHRGPLEFEEIRSLTSAGSREIASQMPIDTSQLKEEMIDREMSFPNTLPINIAKEDQILLTSPIKTANSHAEVSLCILPIQAYRLAARGKRTFSYHNETLEINSTLDLLFDARNGGLVDIHHISGDTPLTDSGAYDISLGEKSYKMKIRKGSFAKRAFDQTTLVRARSSETKSWMFDEKSLISPNELLKIAKEIPARLYSKHKTLHGMRTSRTVSVSPSERQTTVIKNIRVNFPIWIVVHRIQGIRGRVLTAIDANSGDLLAVFGLPSCSEEHEIQSGEAIMASCGHTVCQSHLTICSVNSETTCPNCLSPQKNSCEHQSCNEHTAKCSICGTQICQTCSSTTCGHPVCAKHQSKCDNCGNAICVKCKLTKGIIFKATACSNECLAKL